ncbi:MAG: AAA family ATPase [Clostridia bacterium]
MQLFNNLNEEIKVYAFVGPSGTGKSYRAQMVAKENNVNYIIDDGLLVRDNNVIAGTSAKKAPTKVETVRKAVFINEKDKTEMKKAIKKYKPESILILGTSDGMIDKITDNLALPRAQKRIYIQDVATEAEMEEARRIRTTQGKHVIPVPTFEIKKDFSGYILDPLQIFKSKGKGNDPYIAEKSIIRPTFSYLGNFTISDTVFRQIAEYLATRSDAIHKVMKTRVESTPEGPNIYMEVSINFGFNILTALREFKEKIKKEIEKLTTMNVKDVTIVAKAINMPQSEK